MPRFLRPCRPFDFLSGLLSAAYAVGCTLSPPRLDHLNLSTLLTFAAHRPTAQRDMRCDPQPAGLLARSSVRHPKECARTNQSWDSSPDSASLSGPAETAARS